MIFQAAEISPKSYWLMGNAKMGRDKVVAQNRRASQMGQHHYG